MATQSSHSEASGPKQIKSLSAAPSKRFIRGCDVCGKPSRENSIVCSKRCQDTRLKLFELERKYFPTNGCDNCWGDLHQDCTEQCKREFRESLEFGKDLWSLIRLIYPKHQEQVTDLQPSDPETKLRPSEAHPSPPNPEDRRK